jgi:hypothetical protein
MLKRIFVFVLAAAIFFIALQFASVLLYAWAFDDFTRNEVKFAPIRENDSKEYLIQHIKHQAQLYGFNVGEKDIRVEKDTNTDSSMTVLAVDVTYSTSVDLFYFTYQLRRHVRTSTRY